MLQRKEQGRISGARFRWEASGNFWKEWRFLLSGWVRGSPGTARRGPPRRNPLGGLRYLPGMGRISAFVLLFSATWGRS